jgi:ABC-type Fe3+-hydroxamate transport system substrate-binding protein
VNEADLLALRPTHLIVNKDENELPLVERLRQDIPNILITHPLQVEDNFLLFKQFSEAFGVISGVREAAEKLSQGLSLALDKCTQARPGFQLEEVMYLIWKKPWMSIAPNTYIASMLRAVAWKSYTVPDKADSPLAEVGAARYPILSDAEVLGATAKRIFLSSEPYRFQAQHAKGLRTELHQGSQATVHVIDGEMCSWYGPRAIQGLKYLLQFRQSLQ